MQVMQKANPLANGENFGIFSITGELAENLVKIHADTITKQDACSNGMYDDGQNPAIRVVTRAGENATHKFLHQQSQPASGQIEYDHSKGLSVCFIDVDRGAGTKVACQLLDEGKPVTDLGTARTQLYFLCKYANGTK